MSWQSHGFALLQASLVRPLGLVAAAWLILRVFRVRHPASRHAVWTAVLVGMLLLPIVSVVAPHWTLAVLPSKREAAAQPANLQSPAAAPFDETAPNAPSPTDVAQPAVGASRVRFAWPSAETLIVWCYLAGLLAMLAYRLMGWTLFKRVVARSTPLRSQRLCESDDVVTPVAVGVLRPAVILPSGWRKWNAHTKRAVLAHEFAHLRRGDTLVAALARLVRCVLWFHPLAWWVSRQTSDLAELACDAVALQRVGDPAGYSRVLVAFAAAVNGTGQRVALPGLAMASGSRMNERIDQIFELSGGTMRKLARPRILLAVIGVPAMCLAATVALGARDPRFTPPESTAPARSALASADMPPAPVAPMISQTPKAATRAAAAPTQKFDVASVKPCDPETPPSTGRSAGAGQASPGYLSLSCMTLRQLVSRAYLYNQEDHLKNREWGEQFLPDFSPFIRGGPSWASSDRFTIEAKAAGISDQKTMTGPMLRALLEDRFQLKTHRATEERSMYALTVATGGFKITPVAPGDCWEYDPDKVNADGSLIVPPHGNDVPPCGYLAGPGWGSFHAIAVMLGNAPAREGSRFVDSLWNLMRQPVMDKTGLNGRYSFALDFTPDDMTPGAFKSAEEEAMLARSGIHPPATFKSSDTIFKALEKLGLKLEQAKGPAEYLVIDSAQRPTPDSPSPNAPSSRGYGAAGTIEADPSTVLHSDQLRADGGGRR